MFRGPVGVDVTAADARHGELLHGRRHRFGAERGHLEAAPLVARHIVHACRVGHDRFEEGRAGFEDRRLVALNDRGKTPRVREQGRALRDHRADAQRQGRGDEVSLAGNPAGVADDVDAIAVLRIEDHAHAVRDAGQPAAVGVHHPLRFARRARGVNDEQGPVGVHGLGGVHAVQGPPEFAVGQRFQRARRRHFEALLRRAGEHLLRARGEQLVRPAIAGLFDDVLPGVAHDNHVLHVVPRLGEFARYRGAQLSTEGRRERGRLRQGAPEFAHNIGALQGDFTGQGGAYPAFEPGPDCAEVEAGQHR